MIFVLCYTCMCDVNPKSTGAPTATRTCPKNVLCKQIHALYDMMRDHIACTTTHHFGIICHRVQYGIRQRADEIRAIPIPTIWAQSINLHKRYMPPPCARRSCTHATGSTKIDGWIDGWMGGWMGG